MSKHITQIKELGFDPGEAIGNIGQIVEKHLKRTPKESPAKFGIRALGDKHLVYELRKGRELRLATIVRVLRAIARVPKSLQEA